MFKQFECMDCSKRLYDTAYHTKSTGHCAYRTLKLKDQKGVLYNGDFTFAQSLLIKMLMDNPMGIKKEDLIMFLYGVDDESSRRSAKQLIHWLKKKMKDKKLGTIVTINDKGVTRKNKGTCWQVRWKEE